MYGNMRISNVLDAEKEARTYSYPLYTSPHLDSEVGGRFILVLSLFNSRGRLDTFYGLLRKQGDQDILPLLIWARMLQA